MKDTIRHIGLDVHKDSITIGVADEGGGDPEVLAMMAPMRRTAAPIPLIDARRIRSTYFERRRNDARNSNPMMRRGTGGIRRGAKKIPGSRTSFWKSIPVYWLKGRVHVKTLGQDGGHRPKHRFERSERRRRRPRER